MGDENEVVFVPSDSVKGKEMETEMDTVALQTYLL